MTARDVLRKWTPPAFSRREPVLSRKLTRREHWLVVRSYDRWRELPDKLVIRRCNIRTANRRWRVHNGLSLRGA